MCPYKRAVYSIAHLLWPSDYDVHCTTASDLPWLFSASFEDTVSRGSRTIRVAITFVFKFYSHNIIVAERERDAERERQRQTDREREN